MFSHSTTTNNPIPLSLSHMNLFLLVVLVIVSLLCLKTHTYKQTHLQTTNTQPPITNTGIEVHNSDVRIENREHVEAELDRLQPSHVLMAAGITGRPNIDWCEEHKPETIRTNVIGTLNGRLVFVLVVGCIYIYTETHTHYYTTSVCVCMSSVFLCVCLFCLCPCFFFFGKCCTLYVVFVCACLSLSPLVRISPSGPQVL